jgi:hypothetical protein
MRDVGLIVAPFIVYNGISQGGERFLFLPRGDGLIPYPGPSLATAKCQSQTES